jgi:hypothetical protein
MEGLDKELVSLLRERDINRVSPAALARWLCDELGLDEPSRPVVFGYFSRAYGIRLGDLMIELGPWVGFAQSGVLRDDEFDEAFRGLIGSKGGLGYFRSPRLER